jgi:hypothetical protein
MRLQGGNPLEPFRAIGSGLPTLRTEPKSHSSHGSERQLPIPHRLKQPQREADALSDRPGDFIHKPRFAAVREDRLTPIRASSPRPGSGPARPLETRVAVRWGKAADSARFRVRPKSIPTMSPPPAPATTASTSTLRAPVRTPDQLTRFIPSESCRGR